MVEFLSIFSLLSGGLSMRHHVRLSDYSQRVFGVSSISQAALLMIVVSILQQSAVHAATFLPTTTPAEWVQDSNWDTNSTPNAVGATAVFSAAPTAFQTVTLASDVTVGTITFNTNTAIPTSIGAANATGGRLILDAAGAGPVVITSAGTGNFGTTGSNTDALAATMVFNDDVVIDVQNTVGQSTTGAFRLGGPVTGPGGLTKTGPGLMTWAFTPTQSGLLKAYTGPTLLSGGRVRMSSGAAPNATSSFTINGGQLDPISSNSFYTFGASSATPLKLSGFGPTSGPFAAFPGVIRPDTNFVIGITNNTELVSDSMLHMQGSTTGSLIMSGNMSGKGILYAGATSHDANLGKITLQGSNSYTGGTIVSAGTLIADAASTNAFGTGSVQVVSGNATFAGSQNHIRIAAGATDAIANTSYLNLAGGNAAGAADDGYIDLDGGITETGGGLMLGGVIQRAGT